MPTNWMSTAQGILGLVQVIGLALMTVQVPSALATPTLTHFWLWLTFFCTIIVAVSKAVIAYYQVDAHSIPVIAQTIVANGGLVKTAEAAPPIQPK